MKKKHYIREGGICKFWDDWVGNDGLIDYQELSKAIMGH